MPNFILSPIFYPFRSWTSEEIIQKTHTNNLSSTPALATTRERLRWMQKNWETRNGRARKIRQETKRTTAYQSDIQKKFNCSAVRRESSAKSKLMWEHSSAKCIKLPAAQINCLHPEEGKWNGRGKKITFKYD